MGTGMTLQEVANQIDARVVGDGSVTITGVAHPKAISSPTEMVLAIEPEVIQFLPQIPLQAAVVAEGVEIPEGLPQKGFLVVKRPRYALAHLLDIFDLPAHREPGVHPSAVVDPSAQLDPSVSVGANTVIGPNTKIAANTVVMPNVTIGAHVTIGEGCLFHAGTRIGDRVMIGNRVITQFNASIGSDGFSFVTPEQGSIESAKASGGTIEAENTDIVRINSIGTVMIADDVEVGANACIDRSTLGATRIGKNTKIDNLVQIGHNNAVGENCLIVSQVGIAGSCKIEDRVVLAGQVGIADHLTIGHDAILMAKAGVIGDIPPKTIAGGQPAVPRRELLETLIYATKVKDLVKEVKSLKKELQALQAEVTEASPHKQEATVS